MDYQERPAYDPNGNITSYVRHGYGTNIPMDSLTYNYYPSTNQLQRINDGAGGSYTTDLKDQGTGSNYTYDLIGNLKQDITNGVTNIDWTVYGKIADLSNGSGTITYTYDAAGNRITKTVGTTTTVYVRDAQGNILSIYTQTGSGSASQTETDLYGSSRLGSVRALTVAPTIFALTTGYGSATVSTFTREEKSYELTNHLGNVLTTVTDKKIAVVSGSNSSLIDHFTADIATAQDYYPFGMLMPGRTYTATTATNYRFGFNGKENDNEVKGVGDQIDYGMRYYDPRAGRFMSVDPLFNGFAYYTPYQYAGNMPIAAVDLDGLEQRVVIYFKDQHSNTTQIEVRSIYDNNGSILNQHIHKTGSTQDVAKDNVLVFESKKARDGIDRLSIVDHRGTLTKQEQEIFDKYKQLEPEEGETQALAYPGLESDQYQSQDFINAKTKSYDAMSGILPKPDVLKMVATTRSVKSSINFKGDEAVVEGDESSEINSIVKTVKGKTDYNIVIYGNVNGEADDDFNTKPGFLHKLIFSPKYKTFGDLALSRANTIKKDLIKAGLDPSKIEIKLGDPHAGMNANYQITTVEQEKK